MKRAIEAEERGEAKLNVVRIAVEHAKEIKFLSKETKRLGYEMVKKKTFYPYLMIEFGGTTKFTKP